jgi:hypothetical protein
MKVRLATWQYFVRLVLSQESMFRRHLSGQRVISELTTLLVQTKVTHTIQQSKIYAPSGNGWKL